MNRGVSSGCNGQMISSAKRLFFKTLDMAGFTCFNMTGIKNYAVILTFHRVKEDAFKEIIAYISDNYRVVSLSDMLDSIFGRNSSMISANSSKSPLAITFDDGYENTFKTAYPVLKEYALPATVFLVSGFMGSKGIPAWWDVVEAAFILSEIKPDCRNLLESVFEEAGISDVIPKDHVSFSNRLKKLTPQQRDSAIKSLKKCVMEHADEKLISRFKFASWSDVEKCSDIFDYGSHTKTHPLLDQLSFDEQLYEMEASAKVIQEKTGNFPAIFCYPNGNFNSDSLKALATAGYKYAVTTRIGWIPVPQSSSSELDPFVIPRISVNSEDTLPILKAKLNGLFYKIKSLL